MALLTLVKRYHPRTRITRKHIQHQHRAIWQNARYNGIGWTTRTDRRPRQRAQPQQQQHQKDEYPRCNWGLGFGWGGGLNNSNNAGSGPKDFFEAQRIRTQRRMEQIKREIDADPHAALFGRIERRINPDPIGMWQKQENSLSNFWRSVFGLDRHVDMQTGNDKAHAKTADTTGHVKTTGGRSDGVKNVRTKEASSDNDNTAVDKRSSMGTRPNDLEFDPISGRMVPKKSETQDITGADNGSARKPGKGPIQDDQLGYLSPIERSDESTVASDSADKGVQHETPGQQGRKMTQSGGKEAINMTDTQNRPEPQIQQETPSNISKTVTTDETLPGPKSKDDDTRQAGDLPQIIQSGLHPDPPESTKNGGAGSKNKTPKLKVIDSTKQSEPILVEENEELDLLRASDIRAFYDAKGLDQKSDTMDNQALGKDVEKGIRANGGSVNVDAQGIAQPEQDHLPVDEKTTQATACTEARQPQSQDAKAPEPTLAQVQDENINPTNARDQTSHIRPPTSSDSLRYRVLAYDSSTMQVTRADTNSTFPSVNQTLHPTEVLPRLNSPARFLPYFTEMQNDGYEIVSGGGDILVFKKSDDGVNKPNQPPTGTKNQNENMNRNSEIGEQLEEPISASSPNLSQKPSGETTETHAPPGEKGATFGNTIRRMAFAGTATAATCYAIGVVGGYFRTGGRDGRGIDAFTEFESERRHRD